MDNNIRPDDFKMTPPGVINDILSIESNPRHYNSVISDLEIHEPDIWRWNTESRMEEINKLSMTFDEIVESYPCLPIYLNGLMVTMFMRGYLASQAKWLSNMLPPIPDDGTSYQAKVEDFQ